MRLTELAVKRPVMMSMVFFLFIFLGLISFPRIGADLYPPVNIPYISVYTVYRGAGPEEIETQIIKPIEDAISGLNNIKKITSTASEGLAVTVIEFSMNADLDNAAIDVQKCVDSIRGKLPRDVENPTVRKFDFNADPVMVLALAGDMPLEDIYAIARDQIKDRLQRLPGVAQVNLIGGKEQEIKVAVDRNRLKSYGLTIGTVIARISATNMTVPAGRIDQVKDEYLIRVQGEFRDPEEIKNLSLPLPAGGQVSLKEIATVNYGFKDIRTYSRLNGQDAVAISIQKQSTASLVATAEAINRELPQIRELLPPGVNLTVARDNSIFVHQSLNGTWSNLIEGILTTGLVLFFFLREWRSTLIVLLAIPTSLIATLTFMHFAGYSFNLLTLMGLTMCIGVLVDDTIVVLENIHRHRVQLGKDSAAAALDGRSEIGMAAVAITLSDVVVFGPIAFMTGIVGQFFKQFGLTIVFAVLFSLLVSFTLTPMLAALLFKNVPLSEHNSTSKINLWKQARKWVAFQHQTYAKYENFLRWSFNNRRWIMIICLLAPTLAFALLPLKIIKTEFMPRYDQNQLTISLEMPPGTSLTETDAALAKLEKKAMELSEIESTFATVGRSGEQYMGSINAQSGNIFVRLVPKNKRSRTQWEIAEIMRGWGDDIPGAKVSVFEPSGVYPQMAPIQINITGPDQDKLLSIAEQIKKTVEATPGTTDVDSSWKIGQPEIQVEINQVAADYYGLNVSEIAGTVRAAVEGEIATRYRKSGQETDVRVLIAEANHSSISELGSLGIINSQGQIIRLEQVASLKENVGPSEIKRLNKQRTVSIKANLSDRPLGEVMQEIRREVEKIALPPGFEVFYEGETREMEESFAELCRALIMSIVFVYAILVMLYESYLIPIIRMLSLPLGMVGALLALAVTGKTLNIMSFIGLIMLDGLVAKNSTLLIDYTHTIMSREGLPLREALLKAGTTRLRPILMTTVTMITGMLPTALAISPGSEIRASMAVALIGGLLLSTLLTLVVIPVAYTMLDDLKRKFRGRKILQFFPLKHGT